MNILFLLSGGCAGVLLRYFIGNILNPVVQEGKFPWGTFLVNISGCAMIGLFLALKEKYHYPSHYHLLLVTGFLGAFTTFSGFSAEVLYMLKNKFWMNAVIYIGASNMIGIILAVATYKWVSS